MERAISSRACGLADGNEVLNLLTRVHHCGVGAVKCGEVFGRLFGHGKRVRLRQHEGAHEVVQIAQRLRRLCTVQELERATVGDAQRSLQRGDELRVLAPHVQRIAVVLLRLRDRQVFHRKRFKLREIRIARQ